MEQTTIQEKDTQTDNILSLAQLELITKASKKAKLSISESIVLRKLIAERFKHESHLSYIYEWATRIKNRYAYAMADLQTRKALKNANYKGDEAQ